MKKNAFIAFCASAFLMAACGSDAPTDSNDESGEKQEQEIASVAFSLDTDNSILKWEGFEGEHESHVGTLKFSEGSMVMKGDAVAEGSFVIDMTTIQVTDEGMPDKYKAKLEGHLGADDVWNVAKFATASVSLGEYKDGNLSITLNVLGKKVPATVPVSISMDENGAKMSGKFSVDFTSLNVPLFEPEEDEDESISPVVAFELNASLTKK